MESKLTLWAQIEQLEENLKKSMRGQYFDGYIHLLSKTPLYVALFSEKSMILLRDLLQENPKLELSIDTTGR